MVSRNSGQQETHTLAENVAASARPVFAPASLGRKQVP